jgi:hypothetical protein
MVNPALASPPFRRIALTGSLWLVASGALLSWAGATRRYELILEAPRLSGNVYYSTWDEGRVIADHNQADGRLVTYRRDFVWVDGCNWQAVEQLIPDGVGYRYEYVEHWVSCPPGREPSGTPTPRHGRVTLRRADRGATPTPLASLAPTSSSSKGPSR